MIDNTEIMIYLTFKAECVSKTVVGFMEKKNIDNFILLIAGICLKLYSNYRTKSQRNKPYNSTSVGLIKRELLIDNKVSTIKRVKSWLEYLHQTIVNIR